MCRATERYSWVMASCLPIYTEICRSSTLGVCYTQQHCNAADTRLATSAFCPRAEPSQEPTSATPPFSCSSQFQTLIDHHTRGWSHYLSCLIQVTPDQSKSASINHHDAFKQVFKPAVTTDVALVRTHLSATLLFSPSLGLILGT